VTAHGTVQAVEPWLVRVTDPRGRTGIGEVTLGLGADPVAVAALRERLARPVASGEPVRGDPGDRVDLAIQAGIEAALIDAAGAPSEQVPVPVNATIAVETLHDSVAAARRAVAAGYRTLKLKGGGERSTAELVDRLGAVRSAVGPGVALRLDVNGAWTPAEAEERLRALDAVDLEVVEQPIAEGDPLALARLRRRVGVRIAADESVASFDDARALLAAGAVDVLVVKPARVGGPSQVLAIAQMASTEGVGVVVSTLLETGIGLAAALWSAVRLPDGATWAHGLATADELADDLVLDPIVVRAGVARVPGATGLGVRPDPAAIERFAVDRLGQWA
jgi:L-alanine-DL-glutamate epimerase-like enolase superfamily enzyme